MHTPGSWEWSGLQLLGDCNDDSCSPVLIAEGEPFTPSDADKALIAAAPDLLAALSTILAVWENKDKELGWVKRFTAAESAARAALSKAQP